MKFKLGNTNISIALGFVAVGVAVVFKEKLRNYQEFFQAFYDVLKEDVVTLDEAMRLQFQTSHIVMHNDQPDFNREDIAQAIKNFDYAYDYLMASCQLKSLTKKGNE